MATGLDEVAEYLTGVELGAFQVRPYHEPETDSLICYFRDEPSISRRINKYVTIFVSRKDKSLVGVELKGVSVILRAVEGLGETGMIEEPIKVNLEGSEETVDLDILVNCALISKKFNDVCGDNYTQLSRASEGVKVRKRDLSAC